MSKVPLLIVGSLAVLLLLLLSLKSPPPKANSQTPLVVYCAASNRAAMEAIRSAYEAEFKTPVQVQYGASQTLLSSMEVSESGDLFLPADDSYLDIAAEKGLIAERLPLARMNLVVAVKNGNPLGIQNLADLMNPDVRLVQADPDAAAVGKLTRQILQARGEWESLKTATTAFRSTVIEAANDVKVESADAAIVYDAVMATYPDQEVIHIPEFQDAHASIEVAITRSARSPSAALHFARYLAAEDKGLTHYRDLGFEAVSGDKWEDAPELTLYAGSMLRPAIEETIKQFEQREGVTVNRVYNGCGILVAQMKAGEHPDAYFACDREFMVQVIDLFPHSDDVSENELVILVQEGNPHDIATLRDLTKPGLRVGIGHEKQCAMGWLTQQTLAEGGVQTEVMENVTVQTPSGDMLVNQMKTGSLDAAVAYLSNAAGSADVLDAVRITGIECAQAVQPFAIAQASRHKQLTARLYAALVAAESKEKFLSEGFRWTLQK